ncbi:MAG: nitrite/sulfite reductase [Clostridium sp.]
MIGIEEFYNILDDYTLNDNKEEFTKYASSLGVYSERAEGKFMIRYKFTGGIVLPSELRGIANILDKIEYDSIHFTTRQDIQFHHLSADELKFVMDKCEKLNITSLGSGGPTTRNIQISPLSGVDVDEKYDITDYVLKGSEYLLEVDPVYTLPKKYKISFSNTYEDTVNATVSDLGFIAAIKDGEKGFVVYGGGGMGMMPSVAIKLYDFDKAENITYHMLAMRNIFNEHGERKIKAKARVRHILQRLGEDEFRRIYIKEVNSLKKELNLKLNITENKKQYELKPLTAKREYPLIKFSKFRSIIYKQKQSGYYSLYIHPYLGDMSRESLTRLLDVVELLDYRVSIRLTNTQGFYIRDIKEYDVGKFIHAIDYYPQKVFSSVACTGSTTCKKGILHSKEMLNSILNNLQSERHTTLINIPKMHISGCPNSCGQHQIGVLGLCGRLRKKKLGPMPYYGIFINGKLSKNTSLGYEIGELPGKKIIDFLREVSFLKRESKIKEFEVFFKEKEEDIKNIITTLGDIDEEDGNLYLDYKSDLD